MRKKLGSGGKYTISFRMVNSGYTDSGNYKADGVDVSITIEDGQLKSSNGTSLGWRWVSSVDSKATHGTVNLTDITVSSDD